MQSGSAKLIVLGCGTSTGVPLIGCKCHVCQSSDPRNRRLRSSVWLDLGAAKVLVDTSTDLRQQALQNNLNRVDCVLFTHAHADHVHGVDDLRMFNFLQRSSIACYGDAQTVTDIKQRFGYIFKPKRDYPSTLPRLTLSPLTGPLPLAGGSIIPVPILHGRKTILGFRFGDLAYLTDISGVPETSLPLLMGVKHLMIGALMYHRHATHFSVAQAVAFSQQLGLPTTYLTHMSHNLEYAALAKELPPNVAPAYDGMVLYFTWP